MNQINGLPDWVTGAMFRMSPPSQSSPPQQSAASPQGMPTAATGTWGQHGILPTVMNMLGAGTGSPGVNSNGSIGGAYGPTSVGGAPLAAPQQPFQGGLIQRAMGFFGSH